MSLVELRDVYKSFGTLHVLDGVSLAIERGQCVVIIGASGSGKSVMLKLMVGLLKPDKGSVYFDGRRIDDLPDRDLVGVRKRMGFLFQMGALFDSESVFDNVAFPLVEHTRKSKKEIREIVDERLRRVGLPGIGKKMPAELSGGQRKRVALARAVALDPEVIFYDEPTTGLDPVRADDINELIIRLQRESSVTSVVVTHDMHSAFKIADRIVMLHERGLIFDGTPEEVKASREPIIQQFIRGESQEIEWHTAQTSH